MQNITSKLKKRKVVLGAVLKKPLISLEICNLLRGSANSNRKILSRLKQDGLISKDKNGRYRATEAGKLYFQSHFVTQNTSKPVKQLTRREKEAQAILDKIDKLSFPAKELYYKIKAYLEQLPKNHLDRYPLECDLKKGLEHPKLAEKIYNRSFNEWCNQ